MALFPRASVGHPREVPRFPGHSPSSPNSKCCGLIGLLPPLKRPTPDGQFPSPAATSTVATQLAVSSSHCPKLPITPPESGNEVDQISTALQHCTLNPTAAEFNPAVTTYSHVSQAFNVASCPVVSQQPIWGVEADWVNLRDRNGHMTSYTYEKFIDKFNRVKPASKYPLYKTPLPRPMEPRWVNGNPQCVEVVPLTVANYARILRYSGHHFDHFYSYVQVVEGVEGKVTVDELLAILDAGRADLADLAAMYEFED